MPRVIKAPNVVFTDSVVIPASKIDNDYIGVPESKDNSVSEKSTKNQEFDEAAIANINAERNKILENARSEAKLIVSDAIRKAEDIRRDNDVLCASLSEEAKKNGYLEGYELGQKEASLTLKNKIDDVVALLDNIDDSRNELLEKSENDIVLLAVSIAKKVLRNELKTDEQAILELVKKAVGGFKNTDWVKIAVSNTDAEASCITDKEFLKKALDGIENIEVSVINDAPIGTCLVETPDGIADAGIETQIETIKNMLMGQ